MKFCFEDEKEDITNYVVWSNLHNCEPAKTVRPNKTVCGEFVRGGSPLEFDRKLNTENLFEMLHPVNQEFTEADPYVEPSVCLIRMV